MRSIKDIDKQIAFIDELFFRYKIALQDRTHNEFSDWIYFNSSGTNSIANTKRLGVLIRKELLSLEKKLDERTFSPDWGYYAFYNFYDFRYDSNVLCS